MKRLKTNLILAFNDFSERKITFSFVIVALAIFMIASTFLFRYAVEYEMKRQKAANNIENKNELVNLNVDYNGVVISNQVQEYLYNFINLNEKKVMGAIEFDMRENPGISNYGFIGFGKFVDFYSIPHNDLSEINYINYGTPYENLKLKNYFDLDSSLNMISLYGQNQVLPIQSVFVVADFDTLTKEFPNELNSIDILQNITFVNSEKDLIDSFINDINSLDENIFISSNDLSEDIRREMNSDSKDFMKIVALVGLVFLGLYFLLGQIIAHLTEVNIKKYTINLLVGAKLSDLFIRIFLLNLIIIFASTLVVAVTMITIDTRSLMYLPYLIIQTIFFTLIFPIYPMYRLKKLNLYKNIRGDLNER
ncbi:MAG: hypothetical protein ACK5KQ_04470 [Anaerorhabdus sp.]